jgi:hypothetical protein
MSSGRTDSGKQYNIEFEDRSEYLYAYVTGEKDNVEISSQYWNEIAEECRRNNYKKVLVEEDISDTVASVLELYQFAAELPKLGFAGIYIAFVDRYIEQNELNKFVELVASNRGLTGRVFNDVNEAEKWLLSH